MTNEEENTNIKIKTKNNLTDDPNYYKNYYKAYYVKKIMPIRHEETKKRNEIKNRHKITNKLYELFNTLDAEQKKDFITLINA